MLATESLVTSWNSLVLVDKRCRWNRPISGSFIAQAQAVQLLNYDWHFNTKTVKICLPTLKQSEQTKVTAGFIFKSLKLLLTELSHQWQMSTKHLEIHTNISAFYLKATRNQMASKKFEFITLINFHFKLKIRSKKESFWCFSKFKLLLTLWVLK